MDIERAATLIKKNASIGLALSEKPTLDDAASFFALWKTLEKLGKNVRVMFSGEFPETLSAVLPATALAVPERELSDFTISIDRVRAPIKEIRYERTDHALNIILTPHERQVTKECVTFTKGQEQCDLTITVGAEGLDDLGTTCEASPELFCGGPVIAIARASAAREPFSEITITDTGKSSLAEATAELIAKLGQETLERDSATALLLAIAEKTNNFAPARTGPGTLACAGTLIKSGAQKDTVAKALQNLKAVPFPMLQLLGRAMARSKADDASGLFISMLTEDDFTKTNTTPAHGIPFVLTHMEEWIPAKKKLVLLWQDEKGKGVSAVLKNPIPNAEQKGFLPYPQKDEYLRSQEPFPSFREAEETTCKILTTDGVREDSGPSLHV